MHAPAGLRIATRVAAFLPATIVAEHVALEKTARDGQRRALLADFRIRDVDEPVLREWYVERFLTLRNTAFRDPRSYFNRYAKLSDEEATARALELWTTINLVNLEENILPTRPRATLILKKGGDHVIEDVQLRRL